MVEQRKSNLELLRIICIIGSVAGHYTDASGMADTSTIGSAMFFVFFRVWKG